MLTKFEREVRAAFRVLYGCNLGEGRPPGGMPEGERPATHVNAKCQTCRTTYWKHRKAALQKWCPACSETRKRDREYAYDRARSARRKAAR